MSTMRYQEDTAEDYIRLLEKYKEEFRPVSPFFIYALCAFMVSVVRDEWEILSQF